MKKPTRLQLRSKLTEELKRDSKARCVGITYDRKDIKSLSCGSVSGGVSIKLMYQSKFICEENSTQTYFEWRASLATNYYWEFLSIHSVWYWSSSKSASINFNFFPIFKNNVISEHHIGTLMKQNAEREEIVLQPSKMLKLGFQLTNGTLITPLLLFYLKQGLVCNRIPKSVSTYFYSLPWMHDVKKRKIKLKSWCWDYKTTN